MNENMKNQLEDMIYDVDLTIGLLKYSNFNGGIILDVGACIGVFAERILNVYPTSTVYSFEPSAFNFPLMVNRVKGKNVVPMNIAVTNVEEEITFYQSSGLQQGVVFDSKYRQEYSEYFVDEYTVKGIPLKRAIDLIGPSLVKIDVEGYEYYYDYSDISDSVNTIVMEVHMSDITQEGEIIDGILDNDVEKYSVIIDLLKSQGFEYAIHPDYPFPWDGSWNGTSRTHLLCMTR